MVYNLVKINAILPIIIRIASYRGNVICDKNVFLSVRECLVAHVPQVVYFENKASLRNGLLVESYVSPFMSTLKSIYVYV